MFKRKIYDQLLEWKRNYSKNYSVLIQGARRVGKSTVASAFAQNEYKSCIIVDFSNISSRMQKVFEDINDLDLFFLHIQAETNITLYEGKSVLVFDEIQFAPKVRQAIKHLVKDGRYDYIETGSLISIKKNVENILIPSEEMKIDMFPMDYEEFMWATGNETGNIYKQILDRHQPIGDATNRKLMREFRIYMAVGGMPQAVDAYVNKQNFRQIDRIKREIIDLYKDDFRKIDRSGKLSLIYDSIPAQLALKKKRFVLSRAINGKAREKENELLADLISSKTVLICYDTSEANVMLSSYRKLDEYKLYLSDTGLFTSMIFDNGNGAEADIYNKLLADKLESNLGYLYENAVAQTIRASGRELYYHTWRKTNSTHHYEIDFLISQKAKVIPIEVKSSSIKSHSSMDAFCEKYSHIISRRFLLSQKDIGHDQMLELLPIYLLETLLKELR